MGNIRFEEMQEKLIPEVLKIYNYYILNTSATFHMKELSLEEMKDILFFENSRFRSFAIMDGNCVCGYCILAPFKKREAYDTTAEVTVYLKPEYTGKGIGNIAIAHLERVALENGFHMLLAVVCAENSSSIKLFERMCYEKCAHYREIGKKFGRFLDVVSLQKII